MPTNSVPTETYRNAQKSGEPEVVVRKYSRAFWVTTLAVAGLIVLVALIFWIAPRIQ